MRAALHDTFGDPTVVLHGGDAATPQPGKGEVRIRTVLAPIHNHDLWTVRGQYGYKPTLPAIGGSEATGVIDALG
ncbi:alcohol dehydrogenase catalytic domain-containing protein, partial [Stenotrophomonas sp.]|uniref:alcohol dehydrogenase catalytic domain-containing protein n=1 Tax=Stenotrophomonas sp. TaxID=69392 RepID=UPI0031F310AB